jgi:hypothetical protein
MIVKWDQRPSLVAWTTLQLPFDRIHLLEQSIKGGVVVATDCLV